MNAVLRWRVSWKKLVELCILFVAKNLTEHAWCLLGEASAWLEPSETLTSHPTGGLLISKVQRALSPSG